MNKYIVVALVLSLVGNYASIRSISTLKASIAVKTNENANLIGELGRVHTIKTINLEKNHVDERSIRNLREKDNEVDAYMRMPIPDSLRDSIKTMLSPSA